jgi:hypothetical protein
VVKAVTDPDRQAASQALDDLMRKLIVIHQLLEAEQRLPKRERGPTRCNGGRPTIARLGNRSKSAGGFPLGPPAGAARSNLRRPAPDLVR